MIQKKGVIYCRVSTKDQVEEGNSLVTQEKLCKEYALKNGMQITHIFIEQGESAKTADRTELKELLKYCSNSKNDVSYVVIYKLDRLSRNIDDYSQIRILLKRYGVEIRSITEHFENTPAGKFMENMIANVAQFDNDVRTERCITGMKEAMREGRFVWFAPFGYINSKIAGKSNIIPAPNSEGIKQAFLEVAKNNKSIEQIRMELIAAGQLLNLNEKPISRSQFYRMLRNPIYKGTIVKFGESHKGSFEPFASEEIFEQVQRVLRLTRGQGVRKIKDHPDFPLRRFFKHPNGSGLTGSYSQGRRKKYPYYFFRMRNHIYSKKHLEDIFKELLSSYQFNSVQLTKLRMLLEKHLEQKLRDKHANKKKLESEIKSLQEKQHFLIGKSLQGIVTDNILKSQMEFLEHEITKLTSSLIQESSPVICFSQILDDAQMFLTNPAECWEKMSIELKIKLQRFYFPQGVTFDGQTCRTTKVASIFKAIPSFLRDKSHEVSISSLISNTPKSVTYSDQLNYHYVDDPLWNSVANEMVFLHRLVQENDGKTLQACTIQE